MSKLLRVSKEPRSWLSGAWLPGSYIFVFQCFSIRSKVPWGSVHLATFDHGPASSEHAGASIQVSFEGDVEKSDHKFGLSLVSDQFPVANTGMASLRAALVGTLPRF